MKKVTLILVIILGIITSCVKGYAEEPMKPFKTPKNGVMINKDGILSIVYDNQYKTWYIEYDDVDAFDYDAFYYRNNTPYLDFIKVEISEDILMSFIKDINTMKWDDFDQKYYIKPCDNRGQNIFFEIALF